MLVDITRDALAALGITKVSEVNITIAKYCNSRSINVVCKKPMRVLQLPWMKTAALEAFLDVVQSPKSSTPYLVAFDALRVLPHLTLGHFQVMALTLLLQYSRNSNNYGSYSFPTLCGKIY